MKFLDFIVKVEKYRPLVLGNGHQVAEIAGVEYRDYSNAMQGRLRNPEKLKKIYDSIVRFCKVSSDTAA